jgi:ribosomal protein S18 acetylase RimI-like enzyme
MAMAYIDPVKSGLHIRDAIIGDLDAISDIDAQISETRKADYWRETFEFYSTHKEQDFFFVALHGDQIIGFIVGEIRAWEFGSPPCGWVFAIGIKTDQRLHNVGTSLLETLCERFKQAGVKKVRTMVNRADREIMAFFRSQGLMAGPYQELEMDLI